MELRGKKILFICPKFFDYEKEIRDGLEEKKAKIVYINEKINLGPFTRSNRLPIVQKLVYKLFERIILYRLKKNSFDYIFAIKGEFLSKKFWSKLRQLNPNAISIYYAWDSINNFNYQFFIDQFDKVLTFEKADSKSLNIAYLPIFMSRKYDDNLNHDIDVFFYGTDHSKRHQLLLELKDFLLKKNIRLEFLLTRSSVGYLKGYLNKNLRKHLRYKKIKKAELNDLYARTKTILDLPFCYQTGVSPRVLEAIGSGKKLISTNIKIEKEDFYSRNNIYIWDQDNEDFPLHDFINKKFVEPPNIEQYNINNWLIKIFS